MINVVPLKLEQPLAEYNGKPEIDDGHTKIANELLDAIIGHDFSKRQLKILLLIMRKTYGWNKSEDDISRSQITESTGLANPHVTTALQELQAANVVIISQGKYAKRYKINKYYSQWRVTNLVTITETVTVTETVIITETVTGDYQNGNNSLPKQYPQKTTPKDNTKDICIECLNLLNEKAKRNYKPVKSNLDFIKARLKEGYTKEEIIHVINVKSAQWLINPEMEKYLRPATLFNATKFAQYVAEQPVSAKEEIPEWKRGML
jgi:phage replication O-like protein O